jgi:hypothetical protein
MSTKTGDRRNAIRQQVEFILDNAEGERQEIIVKAGKADPREEDTFARTVAEGLRRRSLSTTPRDVLPTRRADREQPDRKPAARRKGAPVNLTQHQFVNLSLAQSIARSTVQTSPLAVLRQRNLSAMAPVLAEAFVDEARQRLAEGGTRQRPDHMPSSAAAAPLFWSSGSFLAVFDKAELMRLYKTDIVDHIEGVFPNRRVSLPPAITPRQLPQAVEDNKVSAWGLRTVGALATWGAFAGRGRGIRIGLLDTGVDDSHPDLNGKIAAWAEFDSHGKLVPGSSPHDTDQHGTHCAGIMVGGNASGHWIGVAPEAEICAAMVLNGKTGGTDAQVLAGIQWAIEQEVDVINMSLGGLIWGPDVPSTYTSAILNALRVGIPVVTAIGNEGSQTSGSPGNDFLAFAVGATDPNNRAAGFTGGRTQVIRQSPYFPQDILPLVYSKPDLSAPGVAVLSSIPNQQWEYFNGTSMAAPHVSGAIALLLSNTDIKAAIDASERAFLIQDLLTGTAEDLGEAGQDHRFGFGRLDVLRAIGFAKDLGY